MDTVKLIENLQQARLETGAAHNRKEETPCWQSEQKPRTLP